MPADEAMPWAVGYGEDGKPKQWRYPVDDKFLNSLESLCVGLPLVATSTAAMEGILMWFSYIHPGTPEEMPPYGVAVMGATILLCGVLIYGVSQWCFRRSYFLFFPGGVFFVRPDWSREISLNDGDEVLLTKNRSGTSWLLSSRHGKSRAIKVPVNAFPLLDKCPAITNTAA
jgi:hypothetical protein